MVSEIKTIAVVGAGELGREIVLAALLAGYRTILEDVSESRLRRAAAWIAERLASDADALAQVVLANEIEAVVREADLLIEAVAEEMEMKIEMFTVFDKFAKPGAIFASTAHSISIAELAEITFCPERCIGMRFAAASASAREIELVLAPATSEATVAACREVARRMGKSVAAIPETERASRRARKAEQVPSNK
jgi:3-hydroxyacyl-CoA dehydrogenase